MDWHGWVKFVNGLGDGEVCTELSRELGGIHVLFLRVAEQLLALTSLVVIISLLFAVRILFFPNSSRCSMDTSIRS